MSAARILTIGVILFGVAVPTSGAFPRSPHHLVKRHHTENPAVRTADPAAPPLSDEEERRFEKAKRMAKADPAVQTLKAKADAAMSEKEARETSVAYNRALFEKIKELDSTVSERADLMEQAIMRRIDE